MFSQGPSTENVHDEDTMATSQAEPPTPGAPLDSPHQQDWSRLLPDLNHFLLSHSDIRTAFPGLCRRLNRVLPHQHAGIALYEAGSGHLRLFTQQVPPGGTGLPANFILPLDGTPAGEVYRLQRPLVVDDLRSPQFLCETTRELLLHGDRSGCWAPLRTSDSVIGALWISSDQPRVYRTEDAFLLNEVAVNIAFTLANQVAAQRIQELQQRLDQHGQNGTLGFHEIANTSAIGIVRWEGGGHLSNPNDAFLRMIGRTREEMQMIRDCSKLTPPEFHHLSDQAEQELHGLGVCQPFETEFLRQDGSRVPVLISAGLSNNRCPPWLAFVMSLQERRSRSASPPESK